MSAHGNAHVSTHGSAQKLGYKNNYMGFGDNKP